MSIVDDIFGGPKAFRDRVVSELKGIRQKRRISCRDFDEKCGFDGERFPSWRDIEKEPSRLTPDVVSRASLGLGVRVDELLDVAQFLQNHHDVLEKMRDDMDSRLGQNSQWATFRGNGSPTGPEVAYAIILALEEIDASDADRG